MGDRLVAGDPDLADQGARLRDSSGVGGGEWAKIGVLLRPGR